MSLLTNEQLEPILQNIIQWATMRKDIAAAMLVGSWARGTVHPGSDIDLMFLTQHPTDFRIKTDWMTQINWEGRFLEGWKDIDYGAVWSRHIYLSDRDLGDAEVEFSFGKPLWDYHP